MEGKNCNAEKRAGYVRGHQPNQRYATMLCNRMSCSSFASMYMCKVSMPVISTLLTLQNI